MTKEEAFKDLKNTMSKETEDIVYRCKDCEKYNLCEYYHGRKETSQICHYFELQERKTGKWIDTGSGQECSCCGEIQYGYDNGRRYCPWCGAKMEVDE